MLVSDTLQSKSLEWDFVLWLEHAASICENADRRLDGVLILDCAIGYVDMFSADGKGARALLLHLMVSFLLGLSPRKRTGLPTNETEQRDSRIEVLLLQQHTTGIIRSVFKSCGTDKTSRMCEAVALRYLDEISDMAAHDFVPQHAPKNFVPFVIRCVKKSATKVYNHTVTDKLLEKPELRGLIVARYDCVGFESAFEFSCLH